MQSLEMSFELSFMHSVPRIKCMTVLLYISDLLFNIMLLRLK